MWRSVNIGTFSKLPINIQHPNFNSYLYQNLEKYRAFKNSNCTSQYKHKHLQKPIWRYSNLPIHINGLQKPIWVYSDLPIHI